ncbi:DNA repair protein RadA [Brevibacillus borstelensis]|uniref:DNA repair protein RadA n=1 Tax=Brevibacillus borstelensis TaxID=45462 RepID=UPI000469D1E6|nr:DNA repair protein RadA [Brevibacillus borstelensis]MCC0567459.1 DNA repair protein RadA [Brevibacillus borstelensis]MCM3473623.1 DNA repair protein RadA [Brevibacillus borstelensis]MCM3561920.1 DNA repair protein RadA [Brevibacillus borstelensis]MCM3594047.1 DNA repair protein RadA [Brevibacillus borstelensis]MED1853564.1 DNA repair protein RadA [Brevibacillus borstelensis]
MKKKIVYICSSCGGHHPKWQGFCNNCQERGTLVEEEIGGGNPVHSKKASNSNVVVKRLSETQSQNSHRIITSIGEFNRVMGGGIVKDSLTIITAVPGAGKSTLLLQVSQDVAKQGCKVLYASGEESDSQIKNRADRILGKIDNNVWVFSDTSMNSVLGAIEKTDPDLIIIDSIQTFLLEEYNSRPGSPTQTMECANALLKVAKDAKRPRAVIMVGQMTKDNELAGLRALEHLVDTVLVLDGEEGEELKQLSASKNRYGSTGEIGFFSMTETGLIPIDNPSEFFMTQREDNEVVSGSALTVVKEGTRPIILEIESLVSPSYTPYPSRIGECVKKDHLNTLVSILEQRAEIPLFNLNVVIKATGGLRLKEQSSNLAVLMSIVSSSKNIGIPNDTVFIADIGLTGELKKVPALETRIRELERMGFKRVYVAKNALRQGSTFEKIHVVACNTLSEVIGSVFAQSGRTDEKPKVRTEVEELF